MNMISTDKEFMPALPSRASRKINMRSSVSARSGLSIRLPADEYHPRKVFCESKLERNCVMLWLASGQVYDLREQVEAVRYVDHTGKIRKHIFDFLITTCTKKRLAVVVKNSRAAEKPEFLSQLSCLRKCLPAEVADEIVLFTDKHYHPAEAINAERLLYLKSQINTISEEKLIEVLSSLNGTVRVSDLIERMDNVAGAFATILEAIFKGKLQLKVIGLIEPSTLVMVGGHKNAV